MQTFAWCEGSTGEGSDDGGGGGGCGAVQEYTTRRTTGPHQGLLCSSQESPRCRQTEVFCQGWSPSTA